SEGPPPSGTAGVAAPALRLLQQVITARSTASVTVVLPDPDSVEQAAVAALIRTLQLESGRSVRLIWSDGTGPEVVRDLVLTPAGPDELRIENSIVHTRHFRGLGDEGAQIPISPEVTYVVTGGLGALGAAAVRWLLDEGAHDVVVLTRTPRSLPPLLEGAEDRVVVVRCDVADRADLANALGDIRACGSTIRGVIHAAGVLHDAEFDSVTPALLARHFEPKVDAAISLLESTIGDRLDFTLLFSSATGLFGAPGQAAYAAANAALDAVARGCGDRPVCSIAWGSWSSGLAHTAGDAAHLRSAGVTPFDAARGMAVLSAVAARPRPVVLALDYTPTDDISAVAQRLRRTLVPGGIRAPEPPPESISWPGPRPAASPTTPPQHLPSDIHRVVHVTVAGTLGRAVESIDPEANFAALELSSLLAIDLRRRLESRLGIRIATAELFDNPSVTALAAALAVQTPEQEPS
ncbi:MAG: beta-ketoacyl reductase, partial [Stackebrandtia sp.]